MWIFNVFLGRTGVSLSAISAVSGPTTRAQCGCGIDFIRRSCTCGDHLDLVLAIINGPVPASCTNNFNLFEQVTLVPTDSYLGDLIVLVEMYEMDLG